MKSTHLKKKMTRGSTFSRPLKQAREFVPFLREHLQSKKEKELINGTFVAFYSVMMKFLEARALDKPLEFKVGSFTVLVWYSKDEYSQCFKFEYFKGENLKTEDFIGWVTFKRNLCYESRTGCLYLPAIKPTYEDSFEAKAAFCDFKNHMQDVEKLIQALITESPSLIFPISIHPTY